MLAQFVVFLVFYIRWSLTLALNNFPTSNKLFGFPPIVNHEHYISLAKDLSFWYVYRRWRGLFNFNCDPLVTLANNAVLYKYEKSES